jgi:hypothetical protein
VPSTSSRSPGLTSRVDFLPEYSETQTIVEHWDGTRWTVTTDVDGQILNGIQALAANDVWAVGDRRDARPR